jgi:hypothetical protein
MIKTALTFALVLVATAIVAQDAELTPEQQAVKCAAGGGCATFTLDEFVAIVLAEKAISYKRGLQACNSNI